MSTEFYLKDKKENDDQTRHIALRFWGGTERGVTVRFGFDAALLNYIRSIELIGSDKAVLTIGELFESAKTTEFIDSTVSRYEFLSHSQWKNYC
jgi:hypothetical protein|tara:strand:+ start:1039 stop:1320 length:282 start_codon:yes stop_codon:yes gene_type:complete